MRRADPAHDEIASRGDSRDKQHHRNGFEAFDHAAHSTAHEKARRMRAGVVLRTRNGLRSDGEVTSTVWNCDISVRGRIDYDDEFSSNGK